MPEVAKNFNLECREIQALSLLKCFLLVMHWFSEVCTAIDTTCDPGKDIFESRVTNLVHNLPCHVNILHSLWPRL